MNKVKCRNKCEDFIWEKVDQRFEGSAVDRDVKSNLWKCSSCGFVKNFTFIAEPNQVADDNKVYNLA